MQTYIFTYFQIRWLIKALTNIHLHNLYTYDVKGALWFLNAFSFFLTFEYYGLIQGGIIPVNLSTGLTQNLKTSHKIFVGSPALCRENKLWAKYHRNKVLVTRIKLQSQEMNKRHMNNVPGRRLEYLTNKYIFFQKKKILVKCVKYCR